MANLTTSGIPTLTVNSNIGSAILTVSNNGSVNWTTNNDIAEFCELTLAAMGLDIKYQDFQKMSNDERKSLLRDIKIKRVLD